MSSYQTPGRGYRPLSPNAGGDLDAVRELYTGVTLRRYVQPLGGGFHLVRRDCNEAPYEVSSSTGATYREGETVAVAGEAGLRGEIIIGPAATATADYPTVALGLRLDLNIPVPEAPAPVCPVSIQGKTYLGIYADQSAEILYAYNYLDGAYVSTAGTYNYSAGTLTISGTPGFQLVTGGKVIFQGRQGARDRIMTWDVAGGTLANLNSDISQIGGPVWDGGAWLYFQESYSLGDGVHLALYRCAIGASGTFNYVTGLVGAELIDATFALEVPLHLLCNGAGHFQAPSFFPTSPAAIVIPYHTGAGWTLGTGRETIAGAADTATGSNGYPVSGNRSARISYTTLGAANVGFMPTGPTSPEVAMFPASWGLTDLLDLSVSPDGTQLALYGVNGADVLLRLPAQVQGEMPDGCTLPTIAVEPGPEGQPSAMLCLD